MKLSTPFLPLAALAAGGCMTADTDAPAPAAPTAAAQHIGTVHRGGTALDALIAPDARIEKLADGFKWSEGPVWVREGKYLLFSDVPANRIYRWSEADGLSVFLEPSGYAGPQPSPFREEGTNGLIRGDRPGTILVADHGNRGVARLDLSTKQKTFLAQHYQGKRFNSPNDLVRAENGAIYFTDPPYGLQGLNESPLKELPFNGVFRLDPNGEVTLLTDKMSFPNGVILSPDEKTLYVANSDPKRAVIMAFDLANGRLSNERVFADMTSMVGSAHPGLPDGMAVDVKGNIFSTGPGGVHVFAPDGRRLGRIETGTAVANCAFAEDGRTLYLTSHNMLARIRTRTTGSRY
jgi:gluconolactonase